MVWPTDNLTTQHLDAATDDPSQARVELLNAVNKIKAMLAENPVLADANGNFGIQAVDSRWWSSMDVIQLTADSAIWSDPANGNSGLAVGCYFDGANWRYYSAGTATILWATPTGLAFWRSTDATPVADGVVAWRQDLAVDSAGDVHGAGMIKAAAAGALGAQFRAGSWFDASSNASGYALIGNNLYTSYSDSAVRTSQTHPSLGYRGFRFSSLLGIEWCESGRIATTKDTVVFPSWKSLVDWNGNGPGAKGASANIGSLSVTPGPYSLNVTLTGTSYDTQSIFASPDKLIVPNGVSKIRLNVMAIVTIPPASAGSVAAVTIQITKNGVNQQYIASPTNYSTTVTFNGLREYMRTPLLSVSPGDVFSLTHIYSGASSAPTIDGGYFEMEIIQ